MTAHEASSLSSSKSKLWSYDMFLSFSGDDTRNGFTSHLHEALKYRGYHVFIDEDGLERGEEIKEKLFRAIEESRISLIVFSKMYADSSWCLDELVKIMECRDKLGRHVLPIFYHVDPSHIRKQNGDLAEAFQKHEKDIHEEKDDKEREAKQERVKQWREALTKAANLSGHHLQIANNRKRRREGHTEDTNLSDHQTTGNGREAEFIKKIVDESIWKWLPITNELHVPKHLVGIKSRIQGIVNDLSSGGSNDVLMVGIWGMGGLGKTTAAKRIYNEIHREFEFKSFLADNSDSTSKRRLVYLQNKLIFDILKEKSEIRCVDEGTNLIKQQFQHRRVLVIMDNIDEEVQLCAIAGSRDWFGPGSRIIITTRDERLLLNVDKVYPLQEMNEDEAMELFSWHAFGNRWPNEEYLGLSKNVVSYCGGLPLALEVLGSFLFKRTIAEWKSQLEKLKRTPYEKIINPLRISFEGLDDKEKAIFLDISCFFIGKDKDYIAKILDGCGFSATIGISVLRERCLITVEDNKLNMHDLLREMARIIISERSPDRPGKWSRLWNHQEVTDVLTNNSGTGKIEGLALRLPYDDGNTSFNTKAFAKMKKLRLLLLSNVELKGEYKHLPKELIWLSWKGCPLKSIPDDCFNQDKLVVLEMHLSKLVQVWEGSKLLHNLKTLDLSWSSSLHKSPDFSQVPNLEELILEGCWNMSEIHPSIGHLKRLSLVNLMGCQTLISLPGDFYKSKSVETLLLNGSRDFREVHEDLGEMISLRILEAKHTSIREVPSSILGLKNLTRLSLYRISITLEGKYKYLSWEGCPLKSIPDDIFNQDKLVVLKMRGSSLVQAWEGSKLLHNLKTLDLSRSSSLQKSLDFSQVPNLEELILEGCWNMSEIHPSIGHLKRLSLVNLTWCRNLISLPRDFYKLKSVETLLLNWCLKFREVHEDIGEMISLRTLEAQQTAIREVPPSIGHLKRLSLVNLKGCRKLISLPRDFYKLKSVETLLLNGCEEFREVHEDIGEMISLRTLEAEQTAIREVPPSIGHLKRLSLVNLKGCRKLISLPRDFYKLKSVETLLLKGCEQFRELHEDIGKMISLRTLEAEDTAIREVPPSIVGLKNLTRLSLKSTMRGIQLPHSLRESDLTYGASDDGIKDLGSLIYLQHLHLQGIMFHSLPNLSGLSKLETLWLNGSRYLRTILDLPTNLEVLLADDCPALETMPDFSEMSNMRELDVSDSAKLTEVPGLEKSLNSMTWIDMHGCPNLTADFRKNILQGWTSCGLGGIALHGNYVPDCFDFVNEGTKVSFDFLPTDDHNFEGLTLFCLFRCGRKGLPNLKITVISNTKRTKLQAYKTRGHVEDENYEDDYLWQGQLSNNELNLHCGDKVDIVIENRFSKYANWKDSVKITRTGVNLVWDKLMKENKLDDEEGASHDDEGGPSHDASDKLICRMKVKASQSIRQTHHHFSLS